MATTVVNIRTLPPSWRQDSKYVYIGRGSKWGNPFSHMSGTKAALKVSSRDEACEMYEKWATGTVKVPGWGTFPGYEELVDELTDKILVCYCKPLRCHGDYLAKVCNEIQDYEDRAAEDAFHHLPRESHVPFMCVACGENRVAPHLGEDTCYECLRKA